MSRASHSPGTVSASPEGTNPTARRFPARGRAILLGLVLVPLHCWWAIRTEIFTGGSEMIEASLLPLVVFTFFLLVTINESTRRLLPGLALTRAELLVIYAMQTTSVGVAGLGQLQFLNQVLGAPFYYASPENEWESFHRFIPRWWVPDPAVLDAYYKGNSTLFTRAHMLGWAVPVMVWSGFILTMMFGFLCLSTLLRRHWVENERLPFPLVALPLALTEEGVAHGLLRHRGFWLAVISVCVVRSLSAIPRVEPRFPAPPMLDAGAGQLINLSELISTHPWSAIGYFALSFHPIVIGVTYFLSQEVAFSAWFFYLVIKAENILAAVLGFRGPTASAAASEIPYTAEQGTGAFLAIALISLWSARAHLRAAIRKAVGLASEARDEDEALSYRTAVFGFGAVFLCLVTFACLGGLPLHASLLFFTLYILMTVTVSRLRAEAGPMLGYGSDMSPHRMLTQIPGSKGWDAASLTPLSFFHWFDSDYRTSAMPQHLDAMKMTEVAPGLLSRRFALCIVGASAVAIVASFVSLLALYYHYGATSPLGDNEWRNYNGQLPFQLLMDTLSGQQRAEPHRILWIAVGFTATTALMAARRVFFWWPFHPTGFAMAQAGYTMHWVWFPTFIGWAVKGLLLRYGGMPAYRRAMPIFLGLIFGDVLIACLWSMLGVALDSSMYMFFPG